MTLTKKTTMTLAAALLCIGTINTNLSHADTTPDVSLQTKLNSTLRGNFAFTAWRSCVQSTVPNATGFHPESHALLTADAEAMSFVESGIVRFNGDGTLKADDIRVTMVTAPEIGKAPVQAGLRSSCKGTYAVNSDRSCNIKMTCSAQLPGNIMMTMNPFHYNGTIDLLYKTIAMTESDGTIQKISFSQNGSPKPIYSLERVCASSGTLINSGK